MRHNPDLILMDAVMPEMDGFRATTELKSLLEFTDTPILMVTALEDEYSVEQAFMAGACDYITKPVNWVVLKQRVKRLISASHADRKIRHLAYHDTLTGLPNRLLFIDRMDQAISRAIREENRFALIFIDIDHFKMINDSMGHAAGDILLTTVTSRLTSALRRTDTISRLGGDEFTVIVENIDAPEDAGLVANSLLEMLVRPILIDEREVHISGSIGIALYPDDGTSFGTLLKNADAAMYRAKDLGRNMFQFYAAEMSEAVMHRLDMEGLLRNALERQEFILHYQPKFDLRSGRCCGMEALVRWEHPQRGLISPDEFIPLAEETGLIVQLGEWVLRTACVQLAKWQQTGYAINNISINVSARQIRDENFPDLVEKIITETGVNPVDVEIELTESALVENYDKARDLLIRFNDMGLKIALDDFGTGYASMSYLKAFPIDTVKVDRSFVSGLPGNREDMAIVKAISSLTETLDLSLVAEGVENEYQLEFLKNIYCPQAQGYFWSRPLTAWQFEQDILKNSEGGLG
ncbi:MAG: EAL domain-containing protein, partial [Gammaproteobacteria bacterium]|nr:EAL domain-containing protein [Gammaproteobacteria bacterium]